MFVVTDKKKKVKERNENTQTVTASLYARDVSRSHVHTYFLVSDVTSTRGTRHHDVPLTLGTACAR